MQRTELIVILLSLATNVLSAQAPREGFWWSLGVGYGTTRTSCDGCNAQSANGLTLYGALGGTVSPRLLLGADVTGWLREESGVSENFSVLSFAASYYPSQGFRLFLKGGVGYSLIETRVVSENAGAEGSGVGFMFGAGYDIPLFGRYITPALTVTYGLPGNLMYHGSPIVTGWKQSLISGGVSVVFP